VLSDDALIRSNSDLNNQLSFASIQARNNAVIGSGTVIKTKDIGNGKSIYQISLGKTLLKLMPIIHVADMATMETLPEQINLESNGDMFIVENAGDGQVARFIYVNYEHGKETWTRINEHTQVTLEQPDFSLQGLSFVDGVQPPYADGTLIHVKDMGNGKSADFVYVTRTFSDGPNVGLMSGKTFRIKYYQISDTTALQDLAASTDLVTGTQVDVDNAGESTRFVFDGESWVRFGQVMEVPDISARENLLLTQPGHIAHLPTGSTIYTGNEWINLGQTYRVNTLSERNALNVQPGDLVKVADVGNGRHDAFLYADGKWIPQIRGGDAGEITINAANSIQLTNGSEIGTSSVSGGGGAITLNVDKMAYFNNSQVSTSVLEGVGNGGGLTINNAQFLVMNNAKLIAQAYEGQGGNIRIAAEQFIKNPLSLVSASSELGIDGNVQIDSPTENVSSSLLNLSNNFAEQVQIKDACKTAIAGQLPTEFQLPLTLKVNMYRFPNYFIEDWMPSLGLIAKSCN
ncbi:MAG: hypothetical protein VSS52_009030, partial [Thiotrichaceae bacterium]|nr:hypothetical protein [Thiotrichaceae bacterium]